MPSNTKNTVTASQRNKILDLHADGVKFGDIVAKVGLSVAATDRVIDTDRGVQRLAALNIVVPADNVLLPFWVGQPEVANYLHDAPLAALATVALDAKLAYGEWKPVADAALAARSDEDAVAAVAATREAMAERIAAVAAGTWKPVRAAAKAKDPVAAALASVATMDADALATLRAALEAAEKAGSTK